MAKVKKIGSILLKILNAFFLVLLVILLVVLIYLAVGSRGSGLPFMQNFKIFTVMSGSMEPTLNVGGVILVEKVDTAELEEGDIITFLSNDTSLNGKVVSHRIIQVVKNENLTMYITKGDANKVRDDAAAIPENVIGRVIFHVPYLGYLLNFMKTKQGFFLYPVAALHDHSLGGNHWFNEKFLGIYGRKKSAESIQWRNIGKRRGCRSSGRIGSFAGGSIFIARRRTVRTRKQSLKIFKVVIY